MTDVSLPDSEHAHLVSRVAYNPDAHEWNGNEDGAGQHFGLLNINEAPCYLALYWHSRAAGRRVEVGTFKLNLRRLAQAGYAVEKPGRKVWLRFVRDEEGRINIQTKSGAPAITVGVVDFKS